MTHWTEEKLNEFKRSGGKVRQEGKSLADALRDAGKDSEPERDQQAALVKKRIPAAPLVHVVGPVLVRIIRYGPRSLDTDNLSGGAKELRDALTAFLGFKDDSEESGIFFEYEQVSPCDYCVVIEVYRGEI